MKPQPGSRKRPTLHDVAALAGVSRGTVSRVINGGHWVSPQAMAAVEKAIRDTGYSVNPHARSLVTGRSNSIAFLLTEPQNLLFEDPNFSVLLRASAEAANKRQMPLLLLVAGTPEQRKLVEAFLAAGHADGALVVSSHRGDPLIGALLRSKVPMVTCGVPLGYEGKVSYVTADDVGGARQITRWLLERGRTKIAIITGPLDTPGGALRLEGYKRELGERFETSLVSIGDYTRGGGERAMRELLDRRPDLDAVFVASDLMASGAMLALEDRHVRIPTDVAVVGFDDSGLAATLRPPLTTVHQPLERIGTEMVRLLLEVVEGQEPAAVTLPTTIVVRESA